MYVTENVLDLLYRINILITTIIHYPSNYMRFFPVISSILMVNTNGTSSL